MTPLLLCSYKGRYLRVVLRHLLEGGVLERYELLVWDNGGATEVCQSLSLRCGGLRDCVTDQVITTPGTTPVRVR
jgi:hypothetical protein